MDPSSAQDMKRAEETYVDNLRYAADECVKVKIVEFPIKGYPEIILLSFPYKGHIQMYITQCII